MERLREQVLNDIIQEGDFSTLNCLYMQANTYPFGLGHYELGPM